MFKFQYRKIEFYCGFCICRFHFYLSKGKNFNETLELEGNYNFQNESHVINSMNSNIPVETSSARMIDRESKQIYLTL
jgi:hypothetical protein